MKNLNAMVAGFILTLSGLSFSTLLQALEDSHSNAPVIVHLMSRNYRITIKAKAGEPIYLVQDKKGKVVADHLSESQLQAQHPQIYEEFKSAIAVPAQKEPDEDNGGDTMSQSTDLNRAHRILDASIDEKYLRRVSDTRQN